MWMYLQNNTKQCTSLYAGTHCREVYEVYLLLNLPLLKLRGDLLLKYCGDAFSQLWHMEVIGYFQGTCTQRYWCDNDARYHVVVYQCPWTVPKLSEIRRKMAISR